nr:MAG TPA: hypothetical protein [Caudoviricetes sp.]
MIGRSPRSLRPMTSKTRSTAITLLSCALTSQVENLNM